MLNPEDFDRPQLASILEAIATLISLYNPRQGKAPTHTKRTYLDIVKLQEQDLIGLAGSIVRVLSIPENAKTLLKRRSEILSQPSVSLNDEIELHSITSEICIIDPTANPLMIEAENIIRRSAKLIEREQQQ